MKTPDTTPPDLPPLGLPLTVEFADAGWADIFADGDAQVTRLARALRNRLPDDPDVFAHAQALTVILADDAAVRALNRNYRNADKPTNVLTFRTPMAPLAPPAPSRPDLAVDGPWGGDIFLARETVEKEAAEQGKTADHHACHLIVHGFLHLIGYDHETDADAQAMESCEIAVLHDLGIADPYRLPGDNASQTAG